MTAAKKMTKTQLAAELAEATGTDKKTAQQFIESLSAIAAKKDREFMFPGLDKLMKSKRARRKVKDSPVRGKISATRIRAAILEVSRRQADYPSTESGRRRGS